MKNIYSYYPHSHRYNMLILLF